MLSGCLRPQTRSPPIHLPGSTWTVLRANKPTRGRKRTADTVLTKLGKRDHHRPREWIDGVLYNLKHP